MTLREEHEVLIQVFENTHLNVTLSWVTILINNLEVPAATLNLATGYSVRAMAVPWLKRQIAGLTLQKPFCVELLVFPKYFSFLLSV